MKKAVLFLTLITFSLSCSKDAGTSPSTGAGCTYNGHTLHKGSSGGCYYTNSSGNKVYVDRSYCNCL